MELVSVGSGNFDFRSFETNALIYDSGIAKGILKEFDRLAGNIDRLNYEDYKNRPWARRLKEGFAKSFGPLL